ncbi:MAG: protein kinase [Deltaproteobacteria bacterium]|nr:protein kinase [Deltaproteobacteria bacterium]
MFVSDIATMTVVKVKEVSTSAFTKFSRGMKSITKIEIINRNRKALTIGLVILLVINIAGYFIYQFSTAQMTEALNRKGLEETENLATKSGPYVLEKDILSLNVAVKELKTVKDLKFAVIMDHKNNILAHTDTDLTNQKFTPMQNEKTLDSIDGISITTGFAADKTKVIGFFKNIIFSEVEIGKVGVALSAARLNQDINRSRTIYFAGVILSIIFLAVALAVLDRRAKAKALKISRDIEGMQRIGPYLLRQKVARGGMAELFLADYVRRDGFRRKVAVKRILPHLAGNTDFINMFTREARLAALLQHPNIVQIFDYGKIENAYFIAMEFIAGKDLGEIISAMPHGLTVDQAVFIILKICQGLDYSHMKRDEKGKMINLVHRDISPQNMLISYQGEVKISDFGISKARSEPSLTLAGVVKGKMAYLSPEQALGEPIDQQADIYALGLVFYETLTGRRVYKFSSDVEAIQTIPKKEIDPLTDSLPDLPEEINRIVMKCLEKDKDSRYQTASALYDDLLACKKELKITFDAADLSAFMRKHFKKSGDSPEPTESDIGGI